MTDSKKGPLDGVRVLDLTRILAGPTGTQILGDLGADVIKVERPGAGDDTRKWGPPFMKGVDGGETNESAYYLAANRNKRSVTIDIARPEGQALVREMLGTCDIMVENFKKDGLAKFGLGYEQLKDGFPRLIYCSITGFGQTGPYARRPGYDYLAQGMGGIMSLTGEPGGEPMKTGVGVSDIVCGMYAMVAVLGALHERGKSNQGQWIDISLLDTQVAWLVNEGMNFLVSDEVPPRRGNAHANIVPYQLFPANDGHFILAVGNDAQFRRFCEFAGLAELADDPKFSTNPARLENREALIAVLKSTTARHSREHWITGLESRGVPCGPVNDLRQVFDDPQITARGMKISMPHEGAETGNVDLIGSPIRMSRTPAAYRHAPPMLGQHTEDVLMQEFGVEKTRLEALKKRGVI